MGANAIEAISNSYKKASTLIKGFGSGEVNFKQLLFDEEGKLKKGHVPAVNHGSTFGYGFAASGSQALGASNI